MGWSFCWNFVYCVYYFGIGCGDMHQCLYIALLYVDSRHCVYSTCRVCSVQQTEQHSYCTVIYIHDILKKARHNASHAQRNSIYLHETSLTILLVYNISRKSLFDLFRLRSRHRGRIKPHKHKRDEPSNNGPKARDPYPTASNLPASGVLVVRKVADCDFVLFFNVGQEWAEIVDAE